MSAQPVVTPSVRSASTRPAPGSRGRLSLVPPPRPRLGRTPFVVLLIGLIGIGMFGLLLLNTHLQNQEFKASELRREAAELAYAQGELEQLVIETGSTRELTRRATELGMRPNRGVAFVSVPDGIVSGEPGASDGSYLPSALTKSPEQLAKERADRALKRANERRTQEERVQQTHRQRIVDARVAEMEAHEKAAREARDREAAAHSDGQVASRPSDGIGER